jgi:hypothetical protein
MSQAKPFLCDAILTFRWMTSCESPTIVGLQKHFRPSNQFSIVADAWF